MDGREMVERRGQVDNGKVGAAMGPIVAVDLCFRPRVGWGCAPRNMGGCEQPPMILPLSIYAVSLETN